MSLGRTTQIMVVLDFAEVASTASTPGIGRTPGRVVDVGGVPQ